MKKTRPALVMTIALSALAGCTWRRSWPDDGLVMALTLAPTR